MCLKTSSLNLCLEPQYYGFFITVKYNNQAVCSVVMPWTSILCFSTSMFYFVFGDFKKRIILRQLPMTLSDITVEEKLYIIN